MSSDLIRQEIEEKYNDSVMKLSRDDKFYEMKLSTLNTEVNESVESDENVDKKKKAKEKNNTLSLFRKTRRSI